MIHSKVRLASDEEALLTKYFSRYEFACDVNRVMRGEPAQRDWDGNLRAQGQKMAKVIEEKGLQSSGDEVWYRSMDRKYLDDLDRARAGPVGVDVECLVTAASTSHGARFGGSQFTYAVALPAQQRYIAHDRNEIGVGPWQEYLLGPGQIWHYGNYRALDSQYIPVVYRSTSSPALEASQFKACLARAGMRFGGGNVEALAILADGTIVPAIPKKGGVVIPANRYMVMPWGVEETNVDGTLTLFDMRRTLLNEPGKVAALLKKDPVLVEHHNGIEFRYF